MLQTGPKKLNPPAWLDHAEYPFTSRYFQTPSGQMHYVDEGKGETLIFIHGNPSWSFEYRRLIAHFRRRYRCIAPDHLGFGLSAKPYKASYLPQYHATNLTLLLDSLEFDRATLVMHDWGGPIGMSWALDHPERVSRLIVHNSWCWSVRDQRVIRLFSNLVGGPVGRILCRYLNAFPRVLMPDEPVGHRSPPLCIAVSDTSLAQGNVGVSSGHHWGERLARGSVETSWDAFESALAAALGDEGRWVIGRCVSPKSISMHSQRK